MQNLWEFMWNKELLPDSVSVIFAVADVAALTGTVAVTADIHSFVEQINLPLNINNKFHLKFKMV